MVTPGAGGAPGTWRVETKGAAEAPYGAQGSPDRERII